MRVIVALDDRNGMMFNHRRQSQDAKLRERIMELSSGGRLWMNAYSFKQFSDTAADNIIVSESFLKEAKTGDFCFVEDLPLAEYSESIESLVVFRWNRQYPSDMKFNISLDSWKLNSSRDFPGKSHEKITEEVYTR